MPLRPKSLQGRLLLGILVCLTATLALGGVVNALQLSPSPEVQVFLGMGQYLHLEWHVRSLVHPVVLITLCCSLVSVFPSYLASRLKPITAIHHIG